jgi:hypothetical protein
MPGDGFGLQAEFAGLQLAGQAAEKCPAVHRGKLDAMKAAGNAENSPCPELSFGAIRRFC